MLQFLENAGKIAAALGAAPKPPLASGGWGLCLQVVTPLNLRVISSNCANFSASLQL